MGTIDLTSLRANGSRECAPDDRLREAIQLPSPGQESWIASSQTFLAMTRSQITAICLFSKSVTSISPGACVIANGIFAAAITDCGVTPQAQNTGISSAATGTASP